MCGAIRKCRPRLPELDRLAFVRVVQIDRAKPRGGAGGLRFGVCNPIVLAPRLIEREFGSGPQADRGVEVAGAGTPLVANFTCASAFTTPLGSRYLRRCRLFAGRASARAARRAVSSPVNSTTTPFATADASWSASQLVSRMQPWDSDLLILDGSGVPWMP